MKRFILMAALGLLACAGTTLAKTNEVTVKDLLNKTEKYDGKMVKVKGRVTEWIMKGGGKVQFMWIKVEQDKSTISVYSTMVQYFNLSRGEEPTVTVEGKVVVKKTKAGKTELHIDASPGVGGSIEKEKKKDKDK